MIAYLIHWNFVAFATFMLARIFKIKNRFVYFGFTILVTACFGVLTTLIDSLVAAGRGKNFAKVFALVYVRGIYYYVIHVVGNAVFNITLFAPMRALLDKLMIKYYGRDVFLKEEDAAKVLKENKDAPSAELTENAESVTIVTSVDDQGTSKGVDAEKTER